MIKTFAKLLVADTSNPFVAFIDVAPICRRATATCSAEPARSVLLRTIETAGRVAILDQPADHDGGDLAFAVDLRSHMF